MDEQSNKDITEEVRDLSLGEQSSEESTEIKKDTVEGEEIKEEKVENEAAEVVKEEQESTPVEAEETKEEEENADEDEDDDDFGAFSDASFDEFEQPPEPESPKPEPPKTKYKQLSQSLFEEPEMLQMQINELLNQPYPEELPPSSVPPNTDVLNERSSLLLERLVALPYLKPYSWKKSSLRRQLLQTLGISDADQGQIRRKNTDDGSRYKIPEFESLGISEADAQKYREDTDDLLSKFQTYIKEDEELHNLDDEQLDHVVSEYKEQLKELKTLLSIWEYEQKNLETDNKTFEGVVENLVGHTQRLRREETLKNLKKEAHKSKSLGSMFKKKSKK